MEKIILKPIPRGHLASFRSELEHKSFYDFPTQEHSAVNLFSCKLIQKRVGGGDNIAEQISFDDGGEKI